MVLVKQSQKKNWCKPYEKYIVVQQRKEGREDIEIANGKGDWGTFYCKKLGLRENKRSKHYSHYSIILLRYSVKVS